MLTLIFSYIGMAGATSTYLNLKIDIFSCGFKKTTEIPRLPNNYKFILFLDHYLTILKFNPFTNQTI